MLSYILLFSSMAISVYGRTDTFSCGEHQYTVTANELIKWTDCTAYCTARNLVWAEPQNKEEWKCVKEDNNNIGGPIWAQAHPTLMAFKFLASIFYVLSHRQS